MPESEHRNLDEQAVEGIAARVVAALREDLAALIADTARPAGATTMTVGQVALHLGVARSTVYTHWREWGGYKLGQGERAPIRFDATRLPTPNGAETVRHGPARPRRPRRRQRPNRVLITDAPRLTEPIDEMSHG